MAEVKVLIEGQFVYDEGRGTKTGCTVTLIKSNKTILVDTGSFLDKERLLNGLKKEGVMPEDIDIVFLTHIHLDHVVNISLFRNSLILCKYRGGEYPGQTHYPKTGRMIRTELLDKTMIAQDVELILTPGHSDDMVSLIVDTPEGKVVIAGDALPSEEWADMELQPSPAVVDVEIFNRSRRKILQVADYIVPGHGKMFKP
jgi:glyoxylase-like metal-dependent hydrolase (beta-lactamase superfamily II)